MAKTICEGEVVRKFRQYRQSAHIFKIDKFSLVEKYKIEKCKSSLFKMDDYTWRLVVYPNGDKDNGGEGHVSVYLKLMDPKCPTSDSSWQVNFWVSLVLINKLELGDKRDQGPYIKRFTAANIKWGEEKFIPLRTFKDPKWGFLVNDSCLFAAEVVAGKPADPPECLTFIEKPLNNKITWKISKFSTFKKEYHCSNVFTIGQTKWKIWIYPQGIASGKNNSLSVYLEACGRVDENAPNAKTFAKRRLRMLDQLYGKHEEKELVGLWYKGDRASGLCQFMDLEVLKDTTKGYLVRDMLYVGVQFDLVSTTTYF